MSKINSTLTQHRLKELFYYDHETGFFVRKKTVSPNAKNGDIAGTKSKRGYFVISVDNKIYYAHRLAWLYVYGVFPNNMIDHIDCNRLNNRISNLRDVEEYKNHQNLTKPKKNNKSGFMGVVSQNNKWRASISINGKYKYIGMFKTPEEAHEAYLSVKREMHPGCTI